MSYPNSPEPPYGEPYHDPSRQPYAYPGYQPSGPPPQNNLVWAILATVFCCLPLGIVSIVKASQVNGLWAQGRFAEAQKAASDAGKFALWSAIAAAVVLVLYFIVIVGIVGSASAASLG